MPDPTKREFVEAPAGHGKTEAIVQKVVSLNTEQKVLILTHTNAGVNSLRKRLKKKKTNSSKFDLSTIDAFCLKYSRYYPSLSGIPKNITDFSSIDYKQAQKGAVEIFNIQEFKAYLKKKYCLLIVDEYQDCSLNQHNLVLKLCESIDCIVFGDPMQGIFDFSSEGFTWEEHLCSSFPESEEMTLNKPYRWINSGNEALGLWIAETRERLKSENISEIRFIDLPAQIKTYSYQSTQQTYISETATTISQHIPDRGTVLALIPNIPELNDIHHEIAGKMYRPLQSIDRMDSKKLINFLQDIDTFLRSQRRKPVSLYNLIRNKMAMSCMTGTPSLPTAIKNKLDLYTQASDMEDLRKQGARLRDDNSILYNLILDIYSVRDDRSRAKAILNLMNFIESKSNKKFRNDLWFSAKDAFKKYLIDEKKSLEECGYIIRQKKSFIGRSFHRVIGNTLLTKGLEFDHVIIVDPYSFTSKNLYVSLSRAKQSITLLFPSLSVREYAIQRQEQWR
ncbi:AAA family ATPase [Maribellus comscasis]|uniref:AAA family ATPase n=1 Tax=Maribellus comscasis TaxID=2681766 RepID=A0A6I6JXH7_9BACT|nr:UvrD-helicase domain-containing protein [Maribellus comscasis]QGY44842.1 AAA family ATPase [Maribellus comscasis]